MEISDVYREAQQSVIGSLLIDPEHTLGLVMDKLRPEQFRDEWRTLFGAIRELWLAQQPVDPVTVADRAGPGYADRIRQIMALTPTAANVAAYCGVVREQDALLRLRALGAALIGSADTAEARKILEGAGDLLTDRPGVQVWSAKDLMLDLYRRMGQKPQYLPWGIRALDEKLRAEQGDYIVLGAYSGTGKTAMALQFGWHMAARGKRVGFFSLETTVQRLADRLAAQRARLALEAIKERQLDTKDFQELAALGSAADKVPFFTVPCAGATVADLRALTVSNRLDVVFIDYLQLIRAAGKERWEIVSNISMDLHAMAQALGVTVVALSQVTKPEGKGAKISKENLRESAQLIQDAEIIMMVSQEDYTDPGSLRWLRVDKNKDGPPIDICLKFDPRHMDFVATDSRAMDAWRRKQSKPATFLDVPPEQDKKDEEAITLAGWT